jgi:hypothetical protein
MVARVVDCDGKICYFVECDHTMYVEVTTLCKNMHGERQSTGNGNGNILKLRRLAFPGQLGNKSMPAATTVDLTELLMRADQKKVDRNWDFITAVFRAFRGDENDVRNASWALRPFKSRIESTVRPSSATWFLGTLLNEDMENGRLDVRVYAQFCGYPSEKSVIDEIIKDEVLLLGQEDDYGDEQNWQKQHGRYTLSEYSDTESDTESATEIPKQFDTVWDEDTFQTWCAEHGGFVLFSSEDTVFRVLESGCYFEFGEMYTYVHGVGCQSMRRPVESFHNGCIWAIPPRSTWFEEDAWLFVCFNREDIDKGDLNFRVLEHYDHSQREEVVDVLCNKVGSTVDTFDTFCAQCNLALISSKDHIFKLLNGHGYIDFDNYMPVQYFLEQELPVVHVPEINQIT